MSAQPTTPHLLSGDPHRRRREATIRRLLMMAAGGSIVVSTLIVLSLLGDSFDFLKFLVVGDSTSAAPGLGALLSDRGWRPSALAFDLRTIFVATGIISGVAMLVAAPLGIGSAVYLSEYARPRVRRTVKPVLEILAGVPSVVIGFFALTVLTPDLVQRIFSTANTFNMLAAGIGVGILVTPLTASIAEDALRAVPMALREASTGLGARKRTTILKVVVPAAMSGIVAAVIVSVSRAIGETMVVTIAAGGSGSAPFTASPFDPSLTMTSAIANLATGSDAPTVGDPFASLYFVGLLLFLSTLGLNVLGDRIVRKYRKAY
ncbi:MAG: phosphate transport system permease protein [Glaciecola sp.]|jgi:phosphate transport system permease protein